MIILSNCEYKLFKSGVSCVVTSIPIIMSGAKSAFMTSTGKLSYIPPSNIGSPSFSIGLNATGNVIDILTASPRSPLDITTFFLLNTSEVTHRNGTNSLLKSPSHTAVCGVKTSTNPIFIGKGLIKLDGNIDVDNPDSFLPIFIFTIAGDCSGFKQ